MDHNGTLSFVLNGKNQTITNPNPFMRLVDYIRNECGLTGVKVSCGEGGCGACTVLLRRSHHPFKSINSCITPLVSVNNMEVWTIEGLQSMTSDIQEALVTHHGTQCGFCTPGFVVRMSEWMQSSQKSNITIEAVEKGFDGNLCRCTGYRPILDAMKSLSDLPDLEDLVVAPSRPLFLSTKFERDGITYYSPQSWSELEKLLALETTAEIMSGFTSVGVSKYFNHTAPYVTPKLSSKIISISSIPDLRKIDTSNPNYLEIGAAVTLTELIELLEKSSYNNSNVYSRAAGHLKLVASTQIRNMATWAGNIALCKKFPNFPSDVVPLFLVLDVTLAVFENTNTLTEMSIEEYFLMNGRGIIQSMRIPKYENSKEIWSLSCQKIAQRAQNSHAIVSSAVLSNKKNIYRVAFTMAKQTKHPCRFTRVENALRTVVESSTERLQNALSAARETLSSDYDIRDPYTISVVQNLLFKALKMIYNNQASMTTPRIISSGTQVYENGPSSTNPVALPIPKVEAALQASGAALYLADEKLSSTLFGALVYSTEACKTLLGIEAQGVLKIDGVTDVITASDIPGNNAIVLGDEHLFVPLNGLVPCIGASLALVVATSAEVAQAAARKVQITYGPYYQEGKEVKPVLSLREAIARNNLMPVVDPSSSQQNPVTLGRNQEITNVDCEFVSGELELGTQRHFYMEPQGSVATLIDGTHHLVIKSSTQDTLIVQENVCRLLDIPMNAVDVSVRRAGGGFGGKLSRCVINAGAAALAAWKLKKTVCVINDRNTDFRMVGGRERFLVKYKAGFDKKDGIIRSLKVDAHMDAGFSHDYSLDSAEYFLQCIDNAYYLANFSGSVTTYQTNLPTCTPVRGPSVLQATIVMELVIEEIAQHLDLSPEVVRERNFCQNDQVTPYGQKMKELTLPRVWDTLKQWCKYDEKRESVLQFNNDHRYIKRGLAMTPIKYGCSHKVRKDGALIKVFATDGSVIVTHGGVEIGQGINTKVIQVVSHELGVPVSSISTRSTATDRVPNAQWTGGSCTSESVASAAQMACQILNDRLEPIRSANPNADWKDVVKKAHAEGVQLFSGAMTDGKRIDSRNVFDYYTTVSTCAEVELDLLTGLYQVRSVDMVYDCGISLNPAIDIGQIEGAFVMGMGYYLQEEVVYKSGNLVTSGTWEYKIPCSLDIPQKLNISLLKNSNNSVGVFSSKATGEPTVASANVVYFALKQAILASRIQHGKDFNPFHLPIPASPSAVQLLTMVRPEEFRIH